MRSVWHAAVVRIRRRDHSSAGGSARAEVIDVGVTIDVGAPLPHLVMDGHRTVLVFHAGLPHDPSWDGTTVEVIDPSIDFERRIGWIIFQGCLFASLGPPNDEALSGHPLARVGLRCYAAHEVRNSTLIAEFERRNRVHPNHRREPFESLRHIVITFHDETFECVCRSWTSGDLICSFAAALQGATDALTSGDDVLRLRN